MIRRPPRSTRTDTLFPYTTLFRSKSLHMTERTLLRRLKEEGTTFSDVLDRVRLQLAFQYLKRSDLVIRDIAYMLGFSDEGTFSRAFKRWTGRRPSVVAQMKADEIVRSEERRVGKECVSTCRYRWSQYH